MIANFKKIKSFTKEEITGLIAKQHKALDESLELVGERLGARGENQWDLVGIDKEGRLVLIAVEVHAADKILSQLLSRLDWAWEHLATIARMYAAWKIDCDQLPRICILAPSYSPYFIKSISYLHYRVSIHLFTYQYLQTDTARGLLVEQLEVKVKYDRMLKSDSRKIKFLEPPAAAKVTTEEIMEFLQG